MESRQNNVYPYNSVIIGVVLLRTEAGAAVRVRQTMDGS